MKTVSATQARNNLAELLNQVAFGNEEVLIEKMGKPMAALVKPKLIKSKKRLPKGIPPSEISPVMRLPKGVDIEKIFKAMKHPYDLDSLLGR